MIFFTSVLLAAVIFFMFTNEPKAIIVIVPVVLIPIVNIVVWIIGALTTPIIALSAFYFKMKKKPLYLGLAYGVILLILLFILLVVLFKLFDNQRPIF